jgi:hypothetical protein
MKNWLTCCCQIFTLANIFIIQSCICHMSDLDSTAGKDIDDAEVLAILHGLYSITFTPQGRDAFVTVFTLDDNIDVLLPFIEMTGMWLKMM